MNQVNIYKKNSNTQLVIECIAKQPLFIKGAFLIFALIPSIVVPAILFFFMTDENYRKMGTLLGVLLFGLIANGLFRIYLWNSYGKEIFIFDKNRINRIYDYKLFKGKTEVFEFNRIDFKIFEESQMQTKNTESVLDEVEVAYTQKSDYLIFQTEQLEIRGLLKLQRNDIEKVYEEITLFLK